MANVKEIQDRINSIQDTMKITNAMYMISSSKMKRAQKILRDTEPFFYAMQDSIGRVLRHVPDIEHPYFDERPQKKPEDRRIGYFVVTADKGLAGAYNHNVIRIAEEELQKPGQHKLYVLGELGRHYFVRKKIEMNTDFRYTVQKPTMHQARVMSDEVVALFREEKLDEFHIIFTSMNSAVSMEAQKLELLPLKKADFRGRIPDLVDVHNEMIAMSPSAEALLEAMVPNYLTGIIYGCLVESYSSEHNSRMMAMEASTKSAKDMLRELSIRYNRARQAAITQEITEVISGAKAQRRKQR
ncbi:MAG: ATP synthase F1 subunit gamma [Lachnospiraceae bacterium]|jgi:F-type H+-transporting ATPase subunit gamma|nr:ATP synthase F1 subunit gamma [Lachnospiraceae bacterium]